MMAYVRLPSKHKLEALKGNISKILALLYEIFWINFMPLPFLQSAYFCRVASHQDSAPFSKMMALPMPISLH